MILDQDGVRRITERMLALLAHHRVDGATTPSQARLDGAFGLFRHQSEPDLYGQADAVYILYTLGRLSELTTRQSRQIWASRILNCQDEDGWFTRRNLRRHRREHATAYAIGALRLLEVEAGERYVEQVRPLSGLLPILRSRATFERWIERLGCERWSDVLRKSVGWQHVWSGSHVAGGVAAAVYLTREAMESWWPGGVDVERWFGWLFTWLDREVDPRTGYWQRAWWNRVYRRPTLIDLGGAVHFYWIYAACGRPFPHPREVVESSLALQRSSGLYRDTPFCIDLDGNFCVVRPYVQLPSPEQQEIRTRVESAVERSFEAVGRGLLESDLRSIYRDLHGPPGALAAMTECAKLPTFSRSQALEGWQHVLDEVPWL